MMPPRRGKSSLDVSFYTDYYASRLGKDLHEHVRGATRGHFTEDFNEVQSGIKRTYQCQQHRQ